MALDLSLLDKTIEDKNILFTLRFYTWEGNWISLGHHQKSFPSHWLDLKNEGKIKIIRRPSGGGAVLHSGGITYALTFKKPLYKKFSYEIVNDFLIKSFLEIGLLLKNGTIKKSAIQNNCFGSSYTSDLVDQNGYKRIGSAQYWKKGSFLQHGEIQLNPPNELWLRIFEEEAPPKIKLKLSHEKIIQYLRNSFLEHYSNLSTNNIFVSYEEIDFNEKNKSQNIIYH